jgi:hypothetical protein
MRLYWMNHISGKLSASQSHQVFQHACLRADAEWWSDEKRSDVTHGECCDGGCRRQERVALEN